MQRILLQRTPTKISTSYCNSHLVANVQRIPLRVKELPTKTGTSYYNSHQRAMDSTSKNSNKDRHVILQQSPMRKGFHYKELQQRPAPHTTTVTNAQRIPLQGTPTKTSTSYYNGHSSCQRATESAYWKYRAVRQHVSFIGFRSLTTKWTDWGYAEAAYGAVPNSMMRWHNSKKNPWMWNYRTCNQMEDPSHWWWQPSHQSDSHSKRT